jgi:hypothetical protein
MKRVTGENEMRRWRGRVPLETERVVERALGGAPK